MNIGQMLAMLEASGQLPSTSVPQAQTSYQKPRLNWMDVAQGPPAESDVAPVYQFPEVVVEAPRYEEPLPPIYGGYAPETQDPVFAELYGAPPAGYEPMAGATRPSAFMQGTPGPEAFGQPTSALPPLPIKGAMAQQETKKKPSRKEEAAAVIPYEPVAQDVPTGAQRPIGFAPGQGIAMLQEPVAAEPVQPEEPAWRPGQKWQTQFKNRPLTIIGSTLDGKTSTVIQPGGLIQARDDKGAKISISQENNPELYAKIVKEYEDKVKTATPVAADQGYTSQIKVNGVTYPAKIVGEPGKEQLMYLDPDFGPTIYEDVGTLDTEEGAKAQYIPPISTTGEDTSNQFKQIQQRVTRPMTNVSTQLRQRTGDVRTVYTPQQVQQNIVSDVQIPETGGAPLVTFYIKTPDGQQIPISDAEEIGLVAEGTTELLKTADAQMYMLARQRADAEAQLQGTSAETLYEAEIKRLNQQQKAIKDKIAELDAQSRNPAYMATLSAQEKKDFQASQKREDKNLATINKRISDANLMGASQSVGGGATLVQAPATQQGFNIDPNTFAGMTALMSGASSATPGTYRIMTPKEYGDIVFESVKDRLPMKRMPSRAPGYRRAVGGLVSGIENIQNKIAEYSGGEYRNDVENILRNHTTVDYYDMREGRNITQPIDLIKATEEFDQALAEYDANPTAANQQNAIYKSLPFTQKITIKTPDGEEIDTFGINNIRELAGGMAPAFNYDLSVGSQTVGSSARIEQKPDTSVVRPNAGGTPPPGKQFVSVYPLWNLGADPSNNLGYVEFSKSTNIFDNIVASPKAFETQAVAYSPNESERTFKGNVARAMLDDGGNLSPASIQAFSQFAVNLNDAIAGKDGADVRRDITKSIYRNLSGLGFDGLDNLGEARFLADAQKVYDGQMSAADFIKTYANPVNLAPKFVVSIPGQESLNAAGSYYKGANTVPGSSGTSYLFDQGIISIKDLAYLTENSGKFARGEAGGASQHKKTGGERVFWIVNPMAPNYVPSGEYSVLTTPSSTSRANAPLIKQQSQATTNTSANVNRLANNQDGLIDPAGSYAMNNLSKTIGLASDSMKALAKKVGLGPIENIMRSNHREDMWQNAGGKRGTKDKITNLDADSIDGATNMLTQSVLLFNLFPPHRFRKPQ